MTSPTQILSDATKAVPAMRYAVAVAGLGAVVAIVAGFRIDPRIAIFGVLIVLGLMFMLVIFAAFSRHSTSSLSHLSQFAAWCFLFLTVGSVGFLFSSFFFDWPKPLREFFPLDKVHANAVELDMYSWNELESAQKVKISKLMSEEGCVFFHILDNRAEMAPIPESFKVFLTARLEELAGMPISVKSFLPTDSEHSDSYSMGLTERRASYVKSFLIRNGMDAGSISTQGYGKSRAVKRVGTYYCAVTIERE